MITPAITPALLPEDEEVEEAFELLASVIPVAEDVTALDVVVLLVLRLPATVLRVVAAGGGVDSTTSSVVLGVSLVVVVDVVLTRAALVLVVLVVSSAASSVVVVVTRARRVVVEVVELSRGCLPAPAVATDLRVVVVSSSSSSGDCRFCTIFAMFLACFCMLWPVIFAGLENSFEPANFALCVDAC